MGGKFAARAKEGRKEGVGRESPREFSVANPKPSALSRITNVTELNPVAVVSDGAVGYCVICNFMHACPKTRGEKEVERFRGPCNCSRAKIAR